MPILSDAKMHDPIQMLLSLQQAVGGKITLTIDEGEEFCDAMKFEWRGEIDGNEAGCIHQVSREMYIRCQTPEMFVYEFAGKICRAKKITFMKPAADRN